MENRPHSPFGNRAARSPQGQASSAPPTHGSQAEPAESASGPVGGAAPAPEDAEKERRRLEALESLEKLKVDEERRKKQRTVTNAALVVAVLVGILIVGKLIHKTIMTSHFNDARGAFLSAVKRSNSPNPHEGREAVFARAKVLIDHVVRSDPGNHEAYLYDAVIDLFLVEGAWNQNGGKVDTERLTEARHYLDDAFKRKPDYPEAHFYAAVIASFQGDREAALASLQHCSDSLDAVHGAGSVESREWKQQVEAARKKLESAPAGETPPIDVRPPHCMLMGIEAAR